jgi:predicted dehydrogenase
MSEKTRILVIGPGTMGLSHAKAYDKLDGFEIVGFVSRTIQQRKDIPSCFDYVPRFENYKEALESTKPDAVSINTYPDTHAQIAMDSMEFGAHVFIEKPLADTVAAAQSVVDMAIKKNRKLVIGYILRQHPSWVKFIEVAKTMGKPLVMRMNLNQQSCGETWKIHKKMLGEGGLQPIVDCGIHYVDVMCQMTGAKPVQVYAIGAKLSDEVDINNYGQLQIVFEDGSVGWYESAYGPSVSETAFFVKDVIGPHGSVSIVNSDERPAEKGVSKSADIDSHTQANALRVHHAKLDSNGKFESEDEWLTVESEPGHDDLCQLEQEYFLRAIREDLDLTRHMDAAISSLKIVLAADESTKTGKVVILD